MEFPSDISRQIIEYTWVWRAPLRKNWRDGSSIINLLKQDRWWSDFELDQAYIKWMRNKYSTTCPDDTWIEWCKQRLIIGPPRPRSQSELCDFYEDYLTSEEFRNHYVPWSDTWPDAGDHSWCKPNKLPEWAVKEWMEESSIISSLN